MTGLECFEIIKSQNCCEDDSIGVVYYDECNVIKKELKAFEVLKELLLLEVREIGGKYYVKYYNREDGNYIDFEISEDLYEVLK